MKNHQHRVFATYKTTDNKDFYSSDEVLSNIELIKTTCPLLSYDEMKKSQKRQSLISSASILLYNFFRCFSPKWHFLMIFYCIYYYRKFYCTDANINRLIMYLNRTISLLSPLSITTSAFRV